MHTPSGINASDMGLGPVSAGLLVAGVPATTRRDDLLETESDFARILSSSERAEVPGGGVAPGTDEAQEAAEGLVSVVLVEPILKQLRETNQAAPPFGPTSGERQFQSMMDAELAQEITRSARFPLVDQLARDMRARAGIVTTDDVTPTPRRTDAPPRFEAVG